MKWVKTSALFFLLVGVPLVSWYYMQKGLSYRKEMKAELKDYGKLGTFNLEDSRGVRFIQDSLDGKITVAAFVNLSDSEDQQRLETVAKLHENFDDHTKVFFLVHDISDQPMSAANRVEVAKKYDLDDQEQVFFLGNDRAQINGLLSQTYKTPNLSKGKNEAGLYALTAGNQSPKTYPYFVFIKNDRTIANYYDSNDKASMGKLVAHLALNLPREKSDDPKLQRSREK